MVKALVIAKWEYLQKIRSKEFIVSLILTPLFMIGFSVVPGLLASKDDNSTKAIGLLDSTRVYEKEIVQKISEMKIDNNIPRFVVRNFYDSTVSIDTMKKRAGMAVLKGDVTGYLYLSESKNGALRPDFVAKGTGNFNDLGRFEKIFNDTRRERVVTEAKINPELAKKLSAHYDIKVKTLDEKGSEKESDFQKQFFSSMIFVMVLFMLIMLTGGMLVRSLVEEKSNRLIEVLISSCKPDDLLAGKIIGLTALVLTQLAIWLLVGISFAGPLIASSVNMANFGLMIIYFIMGFMLYTAIFVGVGSIVNTEQEAQQMTGYLSMLAVMPVVVLVPLIQNPDGNLIKILSYIPFTTAPIMFLRLNISQPSVWEILASFVSLSASIALFIFASARVFRIGILSYGKVPSLKELWQWIKNPD